MTWWHQGPTPGIHPASEIQNTLLSGTASYRKGIRSFTSVRTLLVPGGIERKIFIWFLIHIPDFKIKPSSLSVMIISTVPCDTFNLDVPQDSFLPRHSILSLNLYHRPHPSFIQNATNFLHTLTFFTSDRFPLLHSQIILQFIFQACPPCRFKSVLDAYYSI